MSLKNRIIIPIFILLMVGCSFSPNELKLAEHAMATSPDSALRILKQMKNYNAMSEKDKALYGLLYFQALDLNETPLQPDSIIMNSLNYYLKHDDKSKLPRCYFYKARMYKAAQRFDNATVLYLKSLDLLKSTDDFFMLGRVYSDLGEICSIQRDYDECLKNFQQSIEYFKKSKNIVEVSYRLISIGKVYHFKKDYHKAQFYYHKALSQTSNRFLQGFAFQEIGVNYYWAKKFDSAQLFLRKSLRFPYIGNNYSIRCLNLADLFFDINQPDSAKKYAKMALLYPSTFYNQRDCYRILANSECNLGDLKQMALYLSKYQDCNDSLRNVEMQTKYTVLQDFHENAQAASQTKKYLMIIAWILPFLLAIGLFVFYRLRKRSIGKEKELQEAELLITEKHNFLIDNIKQLIIDEREIQSLQYKKATLIERERMERDLYNKCLHINDWDRFKKLMNSVFDNIVTHFETNYLSVTKKEIMWCCLFLLDLPTPDIALILESQPGSLYKLKQRLSQKLSLSSTRELDMLLQRFADK